MSIVPADTGGMVCSSVPDVTNKAPPDVTAPDVSNLEAVLQDSLNLKSKVTSDLATKTYSTGESVSVVSTVHDTTVHDLKVPPDVTVLSNTTVITSASVVTVSSQVQYNKDPDEDLNVPPDVAASVSAVPDAAPPEAALQDVSCPVSISEL